MKRLSFMVVAGEPSGDMLAAELVQALRSELVSFQARTTSDVQPLFASLEPIFFGAGGPRMAAAGVDLNVDMTVHSVIGLIDVFTRLGQFVVLRERLKNLAIQRQPDVIICVDYAGFNRRLARAIKDHIRANQGTFRNWNPKMVQFISPQVWASRPGRTKSMAQDLDLLISIFPFEKAWYAGRVPQLKVEYVGHPMLDRYARPEGGEQSICARPDGHPPLPLRGGEGRGENSSNDSSRIDPMNRGDLASKTSENSPSPIGWERAGVRVRGEGAVSSREVYGEGGAGGTMPPRIVLLPGSRTKELKRHLPVLLEAAKLIQAGCPATWRMVLPSDELVQRARALLPAEPRIELQVGGLAEVLAQADLALASSGTVTMECAFFGVPTVVLYKVSWPEYEVGRRIVKIKHIAMPNLLAGESLFPEFVQQDAIPPKIAQAALELLNDSKRRDLLREKLARVIGSLGGPGAARRAARAVVGLLE